MKRLFSIFSRTHTWAGTPALSKLGPGADPMAEYYHNGLCRQGRVALNIDPVIRRRQLLTKVFDAVVVLAWGLSLLGFFCLGAAVGF